MTATTQDRATPIKYGEVISVPVAAATRIPAGTLVMANATGFATPGAANIALVYLGMAEEAVDNSAGANGDVQVRVRRGVQLKWANEPSDLVTQASLGRPCYVMDNQTVAKTNGTNTRPLAGTVLGIDADGVWVI